ncbi:MAG: 4a-hydroxytetrahydrobiopterin dehydratase [Vulcanimicrobiaceae bacterium]
MSVLRDDEIAQALTTLVGWGVRDGELEKTYDRRDFDGSLAFVNAIAAKANAQNHHPDLAISWNRVTVRLSSHDAGGITDRDLRLARSIDALAELP